MQNMTYPIITPELEALTLERDILALKVEIAQLTDFIEARKVATPGPCGFPHAGPCGPEKKKDEKDEKPKNPENKNKNEREKIIATPHGFYKIGSDGLRIRIYPETENVEEKKIENEDLYDPSTFTYDKDNLFKVYDPDEAFEKHPPIVTKQPQAVYIDIHGIRNEDVELYLNIATEAISGGYIIPRATMNELNSHIKKFNKVQSELEEMEEMLQVYRYAYLRALFSRRDTRNLTVPRKVHPKRTKREEKRIRNMKWYPFDPKLWRRKKPKERKYVLCLCTAKKDDSLPNLICVGCLRYAAGMKDSPRFITPGVTRDKVLAWSDCLPDDLSWPGSEEEFYREEICPFCYTEIQDSQEWVKSGEVYFHKGCHNQ